MGIQKWGVSPFRALSTAIFSAYPNLGVRKWGVSPFRALSNAISPAYPNLNLVDRAEPLQVHIDALWAAIRDRKNYLLELKKQGLTVDVFLGYRSNSDTAGVEVPYQSHHH